MKRIFLNFIIRLKHRLSQNPITYRIARGAAWSLVGEVFVRSLSIVSLVVVARLLGKEAFGEVGIVSSTLGMFGVLAGFGLGTTIAKHCAEFRNDDRPKVGRITTLVIYTALCSGGMMMIVCICISPWLATYTLSSPETSPLLMAGSVLLFVTVLGQVQQSALVGFEAFRSITRIRIWQGVVAPATSIPFVWLYGTQGAISAQTLTASIALLLSSRALRYEYLRNGITLASFRNCLKEWPILCRFAFPSMISASFIAPVTWITNAYLTSQQGGMGELGIFNAANQWRNLIIFLPGLLSTAILPVLSETYSRIDKSDFIKAIMFNMRLTWIIALPITILVMGFGGDISSLFGKQFQGMERMFPQLMVACFFAIVCGPLGSGLAGSSRMWTFTAINLVWACSLVFFSLLLIPKYGGSGLATGYMFAHLLQLILSFAIVEIYHKTNLLKEMKILIVFTCMILIGIFIVSGLGYSGRLTGGMFFSFSIIPIIVFLQRLNRERKLI